MAAQELRVRPAGGDDASERLDRQEAIFREREGELLSRHPGKLIIICGGEVLASDSCDEAVSWALAAHPGEPFFLRMRDPAVGAGQGAREPADAATDGAFERDLARQKRIFGQRGDELLARYPRMSIAVCGDEAFAGSDDDDALSRAEAAHPDRAVYLCSYDPLYPCQCHQSADGHETGRPRREGTGNDAAFEADLARQKELLEDRAGELLARHAGKSIAVCAGEIFVADDDDGALSRAEAAHPERAVYLRSHNPFFVAR